MATTASRTTRTPQLTAAQREHAIKRINQIAEEAKKAVREKHTSKAVTLTIDQKVALIKAGKVKMLPNVNLVSYTNPIHLFNYAGHEKAAVLSPVGKTKLTNIDKQVTKTIDQIILGDASYALEAIQNFEKTLKV